jgi:predicted dehydrogenase
MRAAAKRGRHMLVEKPIALSDRGIQELLDLAEKNKAIVMVGNNLRFHPCVQQAKQWIDAGEIGKPIWAHFTCASQSVKPLYLSDGVILNTGAHEVDMALHLLGPAKVVYVDAVHAQGADVIADFLLLHENGCRSSFHLDFVTPNDLRGFCVAGIDGNVGGDLLRRNVYASGSNDFQQYIGSYDDDYVAEMRAFIDRIEGKDVPGATGADGLATLKVLLDVRKKAGL